MEINFSRNLIKGKITELIFQEMFGCSDKLTILPIGYEHTTPILAQYQHHVQIKRVLENIRNAPDFALITEDKSQVYLVEVKYRNGFTKEDILKIATDLSTRWNPSHLFVASPDKFYFSPCNTIVHSGGEIEELKESWIGKEVQIAYLSLLREFMVKSDSS
jgi:hypothetical protein